MCVLCVCVCVYTFLLTLKSIQCFSDTTEISTLDSETCSIYPKIHLLCKPL